MNSYPPELLMQLAPVMFVAGLDALSSTGVAEEKPEAASDDAEIPSSEHQQDPYTLLKIRLREALTSQRKVSIYQPNKSKAFQVILVNSDVTFPPRKLLARTAASSASHPAAAAVDDLAYSYSSSGVPHSPLSPLSPSSPLFPDGLIAPIWIRKHTTLVPSVFVLFLRIFEYPPHVPKSPLDHPDSTRDKEREQEERKRDTELAAEIAQRKKATNERAIKLTVVLIASRQLLDDPTLDPRLTFIRRQSGLDSRAALFVLSPVSQAELHDFVQSLQQALYDPALDYYTNHSKRVRRKRNRHAQSYPTSTSHANPHSPNIPRPLRPEGWTVRYEYKMACFAEFRGEDEVALKHYQDAYATLCIMFGSTVILPPRTKRWAEAKVLADCINIKVTKLYLYNNEHALALSHHSAHVRQFGDFSRGWGIGEETFEFWSWMARQHRILAELLEHGTRSTLVIPKHKPSPLVVSSSSNTSSFAPGSGATLSSTLPAGAGGGAPSLSRSQMLGPTPNPLNLESARATVGINPSHALQHPGFYYYTAARCTELRKERFDDAVRVEKEGKMSKSPGFVNEKKVDHYALILELYTKAYDLFKKYSSAGQSQAATSSTTAPSISRLTLWIAHQTACTYYKAGKYQMAIRFFEKIAKTFRREEWSALLKPILSTWYACAQQMGDVDLSIRLLLEMIAQGSEDLEAAINLEEDLLAVLQSTVPSSTSTPLTINQIDCVPLLNTSLVFWPKNLIVDQRAAFQFTISSSIHTSLTSLPFNSLTIEFSSEDIPPVVIRHYSSMSDLDGDTPSPLNVLKLGDLPLSADEEPQTNLRWKPGSSLLILGSLSSPVPACITINRVVLSLSYASWNVDVEMDAVATRFDSIPEPRWLRSMDQNAPRFIPMSQESSQVIFRNRPRTIDVNVSHMAPAYLDEPYPMTIEVTNTDDEDLKVSLNVLLQPTAIDHAVNSIELDDHITSSLIRGVSLGTLKPGASVSKTLTLTSKGGPGERMLDLSVLYHHPVVVSAAATGDATSATSEGEHDAEEDKESEVEDTAEDASEILQTITIPVQAALKATFDVAFGRMPGLAGGGSEQTALSDLRTFQDGYWKTADGTEATVLTRFEFLEPWGTEIESVQLVVNDDPRTRLLDSSKDEGELPDKFLPGDEFCQVCRLVLAPPIDRETEIVTSPEPGYYAVTWRKILSHDARGPTCTSIYRLPPLEPPMEDLIALLDAPAVAHLHMPFRMSITIRNHHAEKAANIVVAVEAEPGDSFIVAGLRSGRLPILLPDSEERLEWQVIPVDCGYVRLPRVKVWNKRGVSSATPTNTVVAGGSGGGTMAEEMGADGELVRVVKAHSQHRISPSSEGQQTEDVHTVLVLPT